MALVNQLQLLKDLLFMIRAEIAISLLVSVDMGYLLWPKRETHQKTLFSQSPILYDPIVSKSWFAYLMYEKSFNTRIVK